VLFDALDQNWCALRYCVLDQNWCAQRYDDKSTYETFVEYIIKQSNPICFPYVSATIRFCTQQVSRAGNSVFRPMLAAATDSPAATTRHRPETKT
jgi:hypothetical protein